MTTTPLVGILMGSKNDWETMQHTALTLKALGIPCEAHVASAHRTPEKVVEFCRGAEGRGLKERPTWRGSAPARRTCRCWACP